MTKPSSLLLCLLFFASLAACDVEVKSSDSCGDGFLDPGEQCDGAQTTAQRCTDLGYYQQDGDLVCKADCTLDTSVCSESCGDGLIQAPTEVCDGVALAGASCDSLGRGAGTLACRADCAAYDFSGCDVDDFCGDGEIFEGHEDCEGDDLAGQTCEIMGLRAGTLACQANCSFDLSGCGGRCGDSEIQAAYEQCDTENFGGDTCRSLGTFTGQLACTNLCVTETLGCKTMDFMDMGPSHACALLSDWGIGCWGANDAGQLGDGTSEPRLTITPIDLGRHYFQVSVGETHTCAVADDGGNTAAFCWGANDAGQLGDGTDVDRPVPTRVPGLNNVIQVETLVDSTCALTILGQVFCWGDNGYGQLGDGTNVDRPSPVQVQGIEGADALTVGAHFACARILTGSNNQELWCWGSNASGQLGQDPVETPSSPAPIQGPIEGPKAIAAGASFMCVISVSDNLFCWGDNALGQLGDDTQTPRYQPQMVGSLTVSFLSVGTGHTCVKVSPLGGSEELYCWGLNGSRQITDSSDIFILTPTVVTLTDPRETFRIFAGTYSTCASVGSGAGLFCWGDNSSGLLGDGTALPRSGPVEVAP
ncbi:hypothetical protein KKD52_00705 [Myxococcota bacterium]|nr:hypothetical protein [Myxococcota bacterium]MBU1413783.1 hypothetical protein [Myxococcota bacterium]MBU1508850.1 hypothetical protein [Myxococcota bacterium]